MDQIARIGRALGDEGRVRALVCLHHGELCLCHLIDLLQLAPSTVSKHMSVLRDAGLVESRKEGRWQYYRLAEESPDAAVRGALAWLREATRNDIREQRDSVHAVRQRDKTELCSCYKL